MGEMFELLKEGLNDILEQQKGKKKLKTRVIETPAPAIQYTAKDVKRIRDTLHFPQSIFAQYLNVSIKTVQSWEAGRRVPSHSALRLLEIMDKGLYPKKNNRRTA